MKTALLVIGGFITFLAFLPLSRREDWWIRISDFPRVQLAVLSLITCLVYLFVCGLTATLDYIFVSLMFLICLYEAAGMIAYTPLVPVQVQSSEASRNAATSFNFLISNVMMENRDAAHIFKIVDEEKPDAVLLCETDEWWIKQLERIEENYPHTIKCPLDNHYGMALYSRLTLNIKRVDYLIQDDVPSFFVILALPSGDEIELHCVHPRPPVPEETARSTERDGELLLVGKSLRDSKLPVIVAGDLNDVAWSRTTKLFQKVSGLLDPRKGRGFYNSFHAKYRLVRFPLDHVFHSRHFRLISLKRLEAGGSDHFPIFISLSHELDAVTEHEKPAATVEEKVEAEEKIEKAVEENE